MKHITPLLASSCEVYPPFVLAVLDAEMRQLPRMDALNAENLTLDALAAATEVAQPYLQRLSQMAPCTYAALAQLFVRLPAPTEDDENTPQCPQEDAPMTLMPAPAEPTTAQIPFHGSALRVAKEGETVWIAVKPICEHLGIAWQAQRTKLVEDVRFNCNDIVMVASDRKLRPMTCLRQDQLLGWLYTINPNKVGEEVRPLLLAYQHETTAAINSYWTKGMAARSAAAAPDMTDPIVMAQHLGRLSQQFIEAETQRRALAAQAETDRPKVEGYEQLIGTDGLFSIREVALSLGYGNVEFFRMLREEGILIDGQRAGREQHNQPYKYYRERGYFEVKPRAFTRGNVEHTYTRTYVTGAGFDMLRRRFGK